jgi:hypothetical protein
MTEYLPSEKGVPIRYPSVANLMVDSADRNVNVYPSPYDFQITKPNSILNGFFTRVATTEVVLEWCQDNISFDLSNNVLIVDISGTIGAVSDTPLTLQDGIYNVESAIDAIIEELNDLSGTTGITFSAGVLPNGTVSILPSNPTCEFLINASKLQEQLGLTPDVLTPENYISCPDLRPYRYIDFVSSDLTYCQDVKDSDTTNISRDVLCRWYFSFDDPPTFDGYGFPILMGYTRFCLRRIFNPPKQIKWESNLPIGNLRFQVYGDDGNLLPLPEAVFGEPKNEWLMTLQISEV